MILLFGFICVIIGFVCGITAERIVTNKKLELQKNTHQSAIRRTYDETWHSAWIAASMSPSNVYDRYNEIFQSEK